MYISICILVYMCISIFFADEEDRRDAYTALREVYMYVCIYVYICEICIYMYIYICI
jgi:hypothetical protein